MIPPNVAPPKTIVIRYPGAEAKLRKQFVYQTFRSAAEMVKERLVPGNRLLVKFGEEIVGEGQAILVETTDLERVTPYDAIVAGYEDVDHLKADLRKTILVGVKKPAETEFWKILFRWL